MSDAEEFLSALYHSLRASRRRRVVQILDAEDDELFSTRKLAKKISGIEQGVPETRATGEPYRNAYNALSQTHLPTLAEAEIVIYDPERQIVSRGPNLELAVLLLVITAPTVSLFSSLTTPDQEYEEN